MMTRSSLLAFAAVAGLVAASTAAEARGPGGGQPGNSLAFSRSSSGNSVKTSTSIQYKPSGSMPKHDEPYRKWKYRPIEVFSAPSVVIVSPPPTVAPVTAPKVVTVPAGPTSGGATAVASQAEPSGPAHAATACL